MARLVQRYEMDFDLDIRLFIPKHEADSPGVGSGALLGLSERTALESRRAFEKEKPRL